MNKQIEEQTNALEFVISDVTKINELVYAGHSVESMTRFVIQDNLEEIYTLLRRLSQSTDGNIRLY